MAKRWYIVHAYTNFERKVADAIKERAKQAGLDHLFEEIVVPTEEVVEVRRGRKVQAERKFLPGYVLVKMQMTDAAFLLIKNTPKVTGFLGSDNKATPISDDEATRILHHVKDSVERPGRPIVTFEIGELVKVAEGPFASFSGKVEEVDEERTRLKVAVSIFGRETPVELEFAPGREGAGLRSTQYGASAECRPTRRNGSTSDRLTDVVRGASRSRAEGLKPAR